MKTLYSFLGGMAASAVAFLAVNEFVVNNVFTFWPSLLVGAAFGFISSLVLGVTDTTKLVPAGVTSGLSLAGFIAVLGGIASLSAGAGAGLLSLPAAIAVFGFVGLVGGIGYSLGNKLG